MFREAVSRLGQFLRIVLPAHCVGCGAAGAAICDRCSDEFVSGSGIVRPSDEDRPAVAALGPYGGRLRSAIHSIKFRGGRTSAAMMGQWLLAKIPWSFEAIVPVPLHPARLRERGYNQAADIARGISRASNVEMIDDALVRLRATRPQSSLDGASRSANVAGAFGLGKSSEMLEGARVLLVDDVITTGATAIECGAVLRSAGAVEIYLAALALRL